ncbi:GNAT family N-acetyltransferase [Patulibacter sp. NPDC049589]|uniref:GNAT family N-acetyltransferase n=1 Tax=Patulibacter sp. NPDC049589 TaxID=3154731 RepID=UPI003420CB55
MTGDWEIAPLRSGDEALVRFLVARLTPQSRYRRFRSSSPMPSAEVVSHLARPDGWHHIALVAYTPGVREPIGLGEVFRDAAFDDGEAAILVVDGWQGRGVGAALLAGLVDAGRGVGLRRLHGEFLAEHRAVRRLLVRGTVGTRFIPDAGTTTFEAAI